MHVHAVLAAAVIFAGAVAAVAAVDIATSAIVAAAAPAAAAAAVPLLVALWSPLHLLAAAVAVKVAGVATVVLCFPVIVVDVVIFISSHAPVASLLFTCCPSVYNYFVFGNM